MSERTAADHIARLERCVASDPGAAEFPALAELLRRSLRTLLPADESRPWMRYAGFVESGDPQASQKIDDVVYGQKD